MDVIYECAKNFSVLKTYIYRFVVSKNRKTWELKLNFKDSDFFHIAGFHYLTDISISRNRKNTLKEIVEKNKITDELLHKSKLFSNPEPNKDIKSRIEELRFLEEYLDTDNIIRIYNTRNDKYINSAINADYIIESKLKGNNYSVYIFLKTRKEDSNYLCVNSFFKKGNVTYGGDFLFWMLKEKITPTKHIILYQHKNYNENANSTLPLDTSEQLKN